MVAFPGTFALCWLLASTVAVAHERFAAVQTGLILSPRAYQLSPAQPLEKRQLGCNPGWHTCDEIGPPGVGICCPDTQYCIVNPKDTSKGGCCQIGSVCDSPCPQEKFQCNITSTITASGTTTTSLADACCARACTKTSQFQCATAFGGGCCSYGSTCGASSRCISTLAPTSSAVVTLVPPGCTTGQLSCATSLGGGCCAVTQSCTLIDDKAHCAEVTVAPTGNGIAVVDADTGLSTGAKAGIAVGVVLGAGLLIGAATWWFLRRRRERRRSVAPSSSHLSRSPGVVTGRVVGGAGREMSDEASDVVSSGRLGGRPRGLTQDYFGPAPAMGPYSETHSTSAVTTPGERGGVPLQPHGPGDIAVPVELDSRLGSPRTEGAPASLRSTPGVGGSHVVDNGDYERYELYGSEAGQLSPYLPSPTDERHR